jgi:hypothetical protein
MIVGSALFGIHTLVTDPHIREVVPTLGLPPSVWAYLTVIGVITYCAHGHGDDH